MTTNKIMELMTMAKPTPCNLYFSISRNDKATCISVVEKVIIPKYFVFFLKKIKFTTIL